MTNKVYQVPYGTKDILPGEMKTRRGIENAIINVFDKWGYDEVKTPDFEYVDTFGAAGAKGDFRFFDRSNNLLALRNDMTAPIARRQRRACRAAKRLNVFAIWQTFTAMKKFRQDANANLSKPV